MFTFDRETVTVVGVLLCIALTLYMYKELKTTKEEMESVKGFNGKLASFLSRPAFPRPERSQCQIPSKKTPETETQVGKEIDENQDSEEESSE
tara:strand:- start:5875 stop:6153 length:279 start_codon:yes stop_codon:yes gene_type:complete